VNEEDLTSDSEGGEGISLAAAQMEVSILQASPRSRTGHPFLTPGWEKEGSSSATPNAGGFANPDIYTFLPLRVVTPLESSSTLGRASEHEGPQDRRPAEGWLG